MTIPELTEALMQTAADLRQANDDLYKLSVEWAHREDAYRKAKAVAYLAASGTVAERSAHVDKVCSDERLKAHLAEAEKEAKRELVKSLQAQLSALQTIAALMRAEMNLAGRFELNA
jgi:hypothetical protein